MNAPLTKFKNPPDLGVIKYKVRGDKLTYTGSIKSPKPNRFLHLNGIVNRKPFGVLKIAEEVRKSCASAEFEIKPFYPDAIA